MRRFPVFILFSLLFLSCEKDLLHLQKVQQLDSHTTCVLNRIKFISNSICIIGGGVVWEQCVILRSADGGYSWGANSFPAIGKTRNDFCVAPDGKVYQCGPDGTVLCSVDSGISWQFNRINNWLYYDGVTYPTGNTGVYISTLNQKQGAIIKIDSNFNILYNDTCYFGLNSVYSVSENEGYIAGYGAVIKTSDNWSTWEYQDINGDNFQRMDIHGNEIWMCGANGGIFHTNNGGNTWKTLRNGNDITKPHYTLRDILFKDSKNGWAVGENGKMIHSDDGGQHWAEYEQFTNCSLHSIALCPNGDLLVGGDNGVLFRVTP